MFDVIDLTNEMFFLDENIQHMRRTQSLSELWSVYLTAQKRLEYIYNQNYERINLITAVINELEQEVGE